jgi:RNA polymerase sigma factor (sigma-70 family)
MAAEGSFAELMSRLRAGDQEAASEIFTRYAYRLIALARSRLDARMRQKVDPEDVVQSVFKSFFLRQADGKLTLDGWDELWTILTVITLRKCGRKIRYFHRQRRNNQQELSFRIDDGSDTSWLAIARDPTPSEAAILEETLAELFRGLEGRERDILELRLQGYSTREIGAQVGRTERTVQRVLKQAGRRLQRINGEIE